MVFGKKFQHKSNAAKVVKLVTPDNLDRYLIDYNGINANGDLVITLK